jgi:hypothetical protein
MLGKNDKCACVLHLMQFSKSFVKHELIFGFSGFFGELIWMVMWVLFTK